MGMRLLAIVQGLYGQRIVDHIRKTGPQDWTISIVRAPKVLPVIVDEPDEVLPPDVAQADLLLALHEYAAAAQLIPAIAKRAGAKAVLCPIDNSAWTPAGLKNQLQRELQEAGVASVFPKTFCTLTEETAGYRGEAKPYSSALISEFAKHFGRPKLRIEVNAGTNVIEKINITRGAPCGSTHYMAEKLVGVSVEDAVPRAGLVSHQYPCLASMEKEYIDERLPRDTLMHVSGYLVNEEVEKEIRPFKKSPQYFTPGEKAEQIGRASCRERVS
jgi:hypothetical protein